DQSSGTSAKQQALVEYFREAPPADAAWALQLLLGKRRKRLITGRRLREVAQQLSGLPQWLFDDCHAQVGDSAETVALLLPEGTGEGQEQPLHVWMEQQLPALAQLEKEAQAEALGQLWASLSRNDVFLVCKLLSGGFRVGVSSGLVNRALAELAGVEPSTMAQRLMGGMEPTAEVFKALLDPNAEAGGIPSGRPYPFFLASPLDGEKLASLHPEAWQGEWKWDGIRGQLIRRGGETFLWSRGEELINSSFPDLVALAEQLPDGTVLDGEVLVWGEAESLPQSFAALQRRLGRQSVGRTLLQQCPASLVAYDLLELGGQDLRSQPLRQRRQQLEALAATWSGGLRLSPVLHFSSWEELEQQRQGARQQQAEGLMLKALDSPYLEGRKRGHWWKHKLEPYRLDAVLLYAQAGSGRRANLFTDYTFGLWAPAANADEPPKLVTFAKAYSGLTDQEISKLDRWIRSHTIERFGPVRSVQPLQVFELAFEGIQASKRHRSGLAVRFPRISRWREDKPAAEADSLASAQQLLNTP
ncbi:MAG: ATP-dependent DNA ligase, partial [Synechococcus sp.]|nr:ATP-dependent DNA ligase [Synechococcus sp.]